MIGDQADVLARLKVALPTRWFADDTPVLDAVLGGFAAMWSTLHEQLQSAKLQTRLATSGAGFLDMFARDYFRLRLKRRIGEADERYRSRIQQELARERGTRAAVIAVLTDLTGRAPMIFEPTRAADTGAWGSGAGYCIAGGWGCLSLPFQCFVSAFRASGQGIGVVSGWGSGAGGWGVGTMEYANLSALEGQVSDADINAAVAGVIPVGTIAWLRISN